MALLTQMPDNNRFYDFYGTQWRITQGGVPGGKSFRTSWLGKDFHMCAPVCPKSTFSLFLNWCVANLIRKYDIDGVYLDGSQGTTCDNTRHGCGFRDAFGRRIEPRNDLACREALKQLYRTIHELKPDGFLYNHANILNAPHIHSMSDLLLPGEELMPAIFGNPWMYTDSLPLERWQSSYNVSKLLGTPAVFLGLSQALNKPLNEPPEDPRVSDPLIAMCLVHDINLFGNFIYCRTIEKIWRMLDESGISSPGTKFTGYWYPESFLHTDNRYLKISSYEFPDSRRIVAVIANPSGEKQHGNLRIGKNPLRGKADDLYNRIPRSLDDGVEIAPRGFAVLEIAEPPARSTKEERSSKKRAIEKKSRQLP